MSINKRLSLVFVTTFSLLFILTATNTLAKLGVGVGTGKIIVEEKLNPGVIYQLPPLTVMNTGDEPANYSAGIAYHQDQEELAPPKEWFSFEPKEFHLEPNDAQTVNITLNVPLKAVPGDYFAYVEGFPTKKAGGGETTVGVAAAAKLYFTIAPANFLSGIYYRILSFWRVYSPWTTGATLVIAGLIILTYLRKNVDIKIAKKDGDKKEVESNE